MQHKNGVTRNTLIKAVNEVIAAEPFHRGGCQWAALPLKEWAKLANVSTKTVERYFDAPPFYCEMAAKDGKRTKIVRVLASGENATKTSERKANELRKIWLRREVYHGEILEAKVNKKQYDTSNILENGELKMSPEDHGLLVGCAEVWPEPYHTAVLEYLITKDGWKDFMTTVKIGATDAQDKVTGDPNAPIKWAKFRKYPELRMIRGYALVALDVFKRHEKAKKAWAAQKKQVQHEDALCS